MRVVVTSLFQRQFERLPAAVQSRLRRGLLAVASDPRRARPGADIRILAGTNPRKFRLRIGDYRIVYTVQGNAIVVFELFSRGRGYRLE